MSNSTTHKDFDASYFVKKVGEIEVKVDNLQEKVNQQDIVDVELKASIKGLHTEFVNLKQDMLDTVKQNADRTWELISKLTKVLMAMVFVIVAFAGVKVAPDVLKAFFG